MPAVNPSEEHSGEALEVQVLVNGAAVDATQQLISVRVTREINRPATANLVYVYGDMAEGSQAHAKYFAKLPGSQLKVVANKMELFTGLVLRARPSVSGNMQGQVLLECEGALGRLEGAPQSAVFRRTMDSDIFSQIAASEGLTSNATASAVQHEQVMQSNQGNLEFLLSRAERAGTFIADELQGVLWQPLAKSTAAPVYSCEYGISMMSFGTVSTKPRWNKVTVQGWDLAQNNIISASVPVPGAKAGSELIIRRPVRSQPEAEVLATGVANRVALTLQEGYGAFDGAGKMTLGSNIEIGGMGSKFDGLYFISKFIHDIKDGNWTTEFATGLSPEQMQAYETRKSQGPVIGVVSNLNDPEGQGRAMVTAAGLVDGDLGWAPVVSPLGKNSMWMPEIGDQVMVAFLDNDVSAPMIVGTLWGAKPPLAKDAYAGATLQRTISMGKDGPTLNFSSDGGVELIGAKGSDRLVLNAGAQHAPGVLLESKVGEANLVAAVAKVGLTPSGAINAITGPSSLKLDMGSVAIDSLKTTVSGMSLDLKSLSVTKIEAQANMTVDAGAGINFNKGALEVI